MKTKPLTFLLALTFLFLFSGSVFGGVIDETFDDIFDRKDLVVLRCEGFSYLRYYSVNLKDKVIKEYKNKRSWEFQTYHIFNMDEVYIKGSIEKEDNFISITRHQYEKHIHIRNIWKDKNGKDKFVTHKCVVGDKKF
jgi:hypothetical protein